MNSLFAAAEDFSEMLEETSKSSKHGTLGEIFNKDKSSEKQLEWERARLKQTGNFKRKPINKRNRSQGQKQRGISAPKNKTQVGGKRKHKWNDSISNDFFYPNQNDGNSNLNQIYWKNNFHVFYFFTCVVHLI